MRERGLGLVGRGRCCGGIGRSLGLRRRGLWLESGRCLLGGLGGPWGRVLLLLGVVVVLVAAHWLLLLLLELRMLLGRGLGIFGLWSLRLGWLLMLMSPCCRGC